MQILICYFAQLLRINTLIMQLRLILCENVADQIEIKLQNVYKMCISI